MKKNKNEQILVNSVYVYYDLKKRKLLASQGVNYPGIPFVCSPNAETLCERCAFQMYPSHNLYYIISNGGSNLTSEQVAAIKKYRLKVVGKDDISRIENEKTATLAKEEINSLINEINQYISKRQIKEIAKKQYFDTILI